MDKQSTHLPKPKDWPWVKWMKRLLLYTHRILNTRSDLWAHVDAEDVVSHIMESFIEGRRKIDPKKIKTMDGVFGAVCGAIKSHISNLGDLHYVKHRQLVESEHDANVLQIQEGPEEEVFDAIEMEKLMAELNKADPQLAQLADCILIQGYATTAELAEAMGIAKAKVLPLRKRLRRLLERQRDQRS